MQELQYYNFENPFELENGKVINNLKLAYHTFGARNADGSNVIWVFHSISANTDVLDWWPKLFGDGGFYDPKDYFIICANSIGSPYGSTKPTDLDFPQFSVRDVVKSQQLLAEHLDIHKIHTAIGGSFGGNQALEFSYSFKGTIDHLILVASCSKESAWGIAVHESQRIAMQSDPSFGTEDGGVAGMKAARSMALLTYRTSNAFINTQTDIEEKVDDFKSSSYMQYQGEKFVNRFNALCYYYLTKCLDSHHIGRNRGGEVKALSEIQIPTLIIGISSDTLIPVRFQRFMAEHIPNSSFQEIESEFGHDGFLIETDQIINKIKGFYDTLNYGKSQERTVLKFGGKSLKNGSTLNNVLEIIKSESNSKSLAVVVSARGESTDLLQSIYQQAASGKDYSQSLESFFELQKLEDVDFNFDSEKTELEDFLKALSIIKIPSNAIRDKILSFGEIISAKAIAYALNKIGVNAGFVDARDLLEAEVVDGNAEIDFFNSRKNVAEYFSKIKPSFIPVITGFIAKNKKGETITLGRNGSNYTATIIASFIKAAEVQNWTDIDGIYSASPKYVSNAVKLEHISYKEANELANFGANILHPKTILPLLYNDIPLVIRNTNTPANTGTLIDKNGSGKGIKAVSAVENVSLVSIEGKGMLGKVGIDARIFNALSKDEISVRLISQASSERGIGFIIDTENATDAELALNKEFQVELETGEISSIRVNSDMAIIAIVGRHNFALEKAIQGLRRNKIWMHLISNSISGEHISLVIDSKRLKKAMNVVHNQVFGAIKTLNLFAIGKGTVGGKLIDQILETKESMIDQRGLKINVIGVVDSQRYIINENGLSFNWRDELKTSQHANNFNEILKNLSETGLENIVIADNTSSLEVANLYPTFMRYGIDIVASNKKANSIDYSFYKELRSDLKKRARHFFYETNVGAGLPIIDTLKHLHNSSDQVTRIKGVFSGSLSYIFNEYSVSNKDFSKVLEEAKSKGFTEPDPREDLSGMDVARKLLILAREVGMTCEFEDVEIESLIPEELSNANNYEAFIGQKGILNQHYEEIKNGLGPDEVLRYVGDLDTIAGTLKVSLIKASKNSPLGNIKNADSIFEIYTKGYGEQPMVIQGAGAGAEVTARGVYSDLLRIGFQV
ncbi:bifunctional aspartate kinase/homoserine dehydrogenase I [Fulvivirga sp.]|uniref:bifunctional aspartate kinase/homoserine dehydrogenase I n=1 Tax=Fulvivirga sp. TaxID=1931237 RepID=UPI0032EB22F2